MLVLCSVACPVSKIESLHPNSRGDNFLVQVIDIRVVLERTKIDGTPLKIAEVLVGDSTGTVLLTCKNGPSQLNNECA